MSTIHAIGVTSKGEIITFNAEDQQFDGKDLVSLKVIDEDNFEEEYDYSPDEIIDLSYNKFSTIPYTGPADNIYLDHNELTCFPSGYCPVYFSTTHNKITQAVLFSSLIEIDLSNNQIEDLEFKADSFNMRGYASFNLSNNKIRKFIYPLKENMKKVDECSISIDLSNNEVEEVYFEIPKEFDYYQMVQFSFHVNLNNNQVKKFKIIDHSKKIDFSFDGVRVTGTLEDDGTEIISVDMYNNRTKANCYFF